MSGQSMGGKDFCPNTLQPFGGAVTTEAGSLFQYFKTLTENADSLLRRWLAPWRGAFLGLVEREGEKRLEQYPIVTMINLNLRILLERLAQHLNMSALYFVKKGYRLVVKIIYLQSNVLSFKKKKKLFTKHWKLWGRFYRIFSRDRHRYFQS